MSDGTANFDVEISGALTGFFSNPFLKPIPLLMSYAANAQIKGCGLVGSVHPDQLIFKTGYFRRISLFLLHSFLNSLLAETVVFPNPCSNQQDKEPSVIPHLLHSSSLSLHLSI